MGSTYLSLTNKLLRRLNEVEISQSDFPSVRGIQATAKDAIKDTIDHINNFKTDWPFNSQTSSQALIVGQEEYDWPADFAQPDWDSFQIEKDDTLNIKTTKLIPMQREIWYKYYKDQDDDSESDGISIPKFVFSGHGNKWGITPSPDEEYTVNFRYYRSPTEITDYDDTTTIPTRFDYVIIAGAMTYMTPFKGDQEAYDRIKKTFSDYLRDMTNQLAPNDFEMYAVMTNTSGRRYSGMRMWTGF